LANLATAEVEEHFIYMFGGIVTLTEAKRRSSDAGTGF
jgi:hypothetical protein